MHSFLGVPILLRGVAYGNLYLTEKEGGEDFTEEDEELVPLLAAQAAVAIENARLYEAATRWSRQLESLNEVGNALATESRARPLLDLVARRLRELLDARLVADRLPAGEELRFARGRGEGADGARPGRCRAPTSKSGRVLERGAASASTRCSTTRRSTTRSTRRSAPAPGSGCRSSPASGAIGVIVAHDKLGRRRPLHRRRPPPRRDVRRRAPRRGRPLRARRARRAAARRRRRRSSSGAGSRASCTTRPARR